MRLFGFLFLLCTLLPAFAETAAKRPLQLDDLYRLQEVSDPRCSPDGKWIAYSVATLDREADKRHTSIWMVSWDGAQDVRLTYDTESESSPRWSPDGQYLSFVSSRAGKAKGSQVWLLDRRGGEARQLTHVEDYGISQYEWSPDSKKLLLVMKEKEQPDPDEKPVPGAPPKPPKPVVIDRYHFKEDMEGYLSGAKHNHVYIFDIESEKLDQLTTDKTYDERNAVWSPDGTTCSSRMSALEQHLAG